MMKNILIIVTLMLVFCVFGMAQSDASAVLDNALKDCLDKNSSANKQEQCLDKALEICIDKEPTGGWEAGCASKAYELWDKELNKIYNQLRRELTSKESKALKTAQRKWLKYRDAEFKLIDHIYSYEKGTMNIPFNAHARLKVVKKRVLELKHYSSAYSPPNK